MFKKIFLASVVFFSLTIEANAYITKASWYGGGERLNRHTSNGAIFNPSAHTCAHRSLPMGTRVAITNISNGRSVICTVTDRGPAAWTGREYDLSRGAAQIIGLIGQGVGRIQARIALPTKKPGIYVPPLLNHRIGRG